MIQFVVSNQSILDPHKNQIVDYIYQQLSLGPAIWVEEDADIPLITAWCRALYPSRLLLHHTHTAPSTFTPGILHIIPPQLLTLASDNMTIFSRHVLIPEHTLYRNLIHWVDDYREKNRELYRAYQQRGLKPTSITLP